MIGDPINYLLVFEGAMTFAESGGFLTLLPGVYAIVADVG